MASSATLDRLLAEFDTPPEVLGPVVALLEAGATPAYLARYRRWEVANLPEERIQAVAERLHTLSEIEQRRESILQQAAERGRRTPELEAMLAASVDQDLLDDLYQSMRPRRRNRAAEMEEKGLLPLALALQHRQLGDQTLQEVASQYLAPDAGLAAPESVLEGALVILADRIVQDATTRSRFRDELRRGILRAKAVNPDRAGGAGTQDLLDFAEPIARIPAGRMLALRRAEREGILRLELTLPEGRHRALLGELHAADLAPGTPLFDFYQLVFDHAAQHLQEICGKDVRRRIKEKADREAVRTHARNLRSQLLAPPLGAKKVLSLRTSGKGTWAVMLAEDGSIAEHKTLPMETEEQQQGSLAWVVELIRREQPAAIALPHGRRQAGAERFLAQLRPALGDTKLPMVVAVDEAASTIFATSAAGKKAIPGLEVGARTAVSLGRRLQDPLLELARMDVRTLGLGHTLDDVHQGMLQRELRAVTGSCLAQVGCDLNTISLDLLEQLPGLSGEQAAAIVEHRRRIGGFPSRAALHDVAGLDPVTVRNVSGMLRVVGGSEPLDATPIHPEDYDIVRAVAAQRGVEPCALLGQNLRDVQVDGLVTPATSRPRIVGVLQQLQRAAEDPRGELLQSSNEGVHSLADLHTDRELRGRVATLTEFGAFVDLGIGHDGLVHISQIPSQRLRDPHQMLRTGEVVTVWVLHVDQQNQKIALSMLKPRHLQEGRLPTLGERMEQQQGRRRPRPAAAGAPTGGGRFRGAGRPGERRGPPEPGQGGEGPDRRRFGNRGRDADDRGDRGDRGRRDRGPREQRVYTVEPAKEVVETRSHKGEVTSLASLRALLGGAAAPSRPADESEPK
ncbi:MAG: helix-hairpin-helix domain-containing protein [Planctomycetes bacterium]|nr:helix-hairpin-helix domain-containing protein [Planctomycetota bacterium]